MASRFIRDLNGDFGEYWVKDANEQIEKIKNEVKNGKITIDENGVAYNCIGRILADDLAEVMEVAKIEFSRENTLTAYRIKMAKDIEEYKRNQKPPTAEEIFEMRCAFGEGVEIVDVLSGQVIKL